MSETGPGVVVPTREDSQSINSKDKLGMLDHEKATNNPEVFTFRTKSGKAVNSIFYSAQEIPSVSDPMKDKKVFIYGEKPKTATDQAWFDAQEDIRNSSLNKNLLTKGTYWWDIAEAIDQENALFMVEATPKNVLDLAFTLGVESPQLRNLRSQLSRGQITDEVIDLTDQIIAGKVIDGNGDINTKKNFDGENLTILALSGDIQAQAELAKRQKALSEIDHRNEREHAEKAKADIPALQAELTSLAAKEDTAYKEFEPEDLVLVRLAPNEPIKNQGKSVLRSAFDITSVVPRTTLHFTLNHVVGTHSDGNWTGMQVAIIAPFDKTMAANGNPRSINLADTYFEVSPGKAFELPSDAIVVKPGKLGAGELYARQNGTVVYKSADYTPEDVKQLADQMDKDAFDKSEAVGVDLVDKFPIFIDSKVKELSFQKKFPNRDSIDYSGNEFKQAYQQAQADVSFVTSAFREAVGSGNMIEVLMEKPLATVLGDFRIRVEGTLGGNVALELETLLKQTVEANLAAETQYSAIKDTVSDLGYKWLHAGGWGEIKDKADSTRFHLLSAKLGIPEMPHVSDPNIKIEGFLKSDPRIRDDQNLFIDRDEREHIVDFQTLNSISPIARRLIYQMGML